MMKTRPNPTRWLICAACTTAATTALKGNDACAGAGGDLMFYDAGNGVLGVGRYDFDGGTGEVLEVASEPIILTELANDWEGGGTPGTDEPGITTDGALVPGDPDGINPALTFPANTALTASANLLPVLGVDAAFWNATGPVDFTSIPLPHNLIVESPLLGELEFDGDGVAPSGAITAWVSDSNGTNHDHYEFLLDEADATATPGIYLISLSFAAGSLTSAPQFLLLGYADGTTLTDEALDLALEEAESFVETNIVPEPASAAALLALGGLALRRRSRR